MPLSNGRYRLASTPSASGVFDGHRRAVKNGDIDALKKVEGSIPGI